VFLWIPGNVSLTEYCLLDRSHGNMLNQRQQFEFGRGSMATLDNGNSSHQVQLQHLRTPEIISDLSSSQHLCFINDTTSISNSGPKTAYLPWDNCALRSPRHSICANHLGQHALQFVDLDCKSNGLKQDVQADHQLAAVSVPQRSTDLKEN
jgi:hypothetical protein